jgi:ATP-dependent Clp protease ATP-binding subunit ClpC
MAAGLNGIVQKAEQAARRRKQRPSTAHLVFATYDSPSASVLLARHGVDEALLLGALTAEYEESYNAVEIALSRAGKLGHGPRDRRDGAVRLLLAILREPRSAGWQCLERVGVAPLVVRADAEAVLGGGVLAPAAPSVPAADVAPSHVGAPPVEAREVLPGAVRPHRSRSSARTAGDMRRRPGAAAPVDDPRVQSAQHALAREVESKVRARRPAAAADGNETVPSRPGAAGAPASCPPQPVSTRRGRPSIRARGPALAPAAPPAPTSVSPLALDPQRFPVLCAVGRNLTLAAAEGRIDPVIGREREIEQLLDVLARRRANNPILVGPAGVGKTAIVEGLALALLAGEHALGERVLIEASAGSLVSGTGVRGALSERLQALRREMVDANGRAVLFIDEIHSVVGLEDGADSVSGELKAALARGELACIGATTEAEYRRVFERDAALARRFTRIDVGEPAPDAARAILRGIAPQYERHHGVAYMPAALDAAIEMSVRFLTERQLPDKAIALIDQAAARVRRRGGGIVDVDAVAHVVSEQGGVPVERLMMSDGDALMALEHHLRERIVGQDAAVAAIAGALRKGAAFSRGRRPLGTFLFLGPTGVGKTEMARAIHELLFPGAAMTRLDMSELSEGHAVARLLGAPPGYVGHQEGGQLTEAVRGRPYQLVLFDEVEKAHPEVLLALLPLLDEGRLTDGRGRTVDFSSTVVVMTSNLGVDASEPRARLGFGGDVDQARRDAVRERTLAAARSALPPELWNRIDEPLYFQPLERVAVARIAERMVHDVVALMRERHAIDVRVDASVFDALIAAGGFDAALGARPMRRTVGRLVEARLADAVLSGELERGGAVTLRGEGATVVLAHR